MWLPSPIYERAPQFWMLLGLLFMTGGAYVGFDYSASFLLYGFGFVCVGWSFCVSIMRSLNRKNPHVVEQPSEERTEQPTAQASEQPEYG